jgi:hypothetical protein
MTDIARSTRGFDKPSPNGFPTPFALSASKGPRQEGFDKLSPNGFPTPFTLSLSKGPATQGFDKLSPNGGVARRRATPHPPFSLSLSKGPESRHHEEAHDV